MKRYLLGICLFVGTVTQAAKIEDITIPSKLMKKNFQARIVLPDCYNSIKALNQIYLLHGASGNHTDWTKTKLLKKFADKYHRIIICPTAGKYSWYNNHNKSEDYIIQEVIPFIDTKYKTTNNRWLTGLSMGGYGAIRLGFKYPKLFSAWGGQSSGITPSHWKKSWHLDHAFGRIPTTADDLFSDAMVTTMKSDTRPFTILCGKQDFFFKDNQAALKKCQAAGVKVFHLPTIGTHNWAYWTKSLSIQLAYFAKGETAAKAEWKKYQKTKTTPATTNKQQHKHKQPPPQ